MKIFVLLIAICAGVLGWYNFHTATTASARENLAYRSEMSSLIGNIKDYGLKHNNDFFVIANGGAGLMESNEFLSEQELGQLLQKVDGVMAESVNYGWDMSMDNPMPPEEQENFQRLLGSARRAGVVPMVLDYAEEAGNVQKAYREDKDRGYLGWVSARRDLDRLPKGLPHNDNDKSVANLREAKNYLVLLNPEAFPSREAYISALANSNYDLLIVDAYYGDKPITKDEVQRLQQKPMGGRRLVAAYMSVGEAEDYRPYWQESWKKKPPKWLWQRNDDWEGSYRVCYWTREWQSMLMGSKDSYLDIILEAGFDGVFLDVVDVFYAFEEQAK